MENPTKVKESAHSLNDRKAAGKWDWLEGGGAGSADCSSRAGNCSLSVAGGLGRPLGQRRRSSHCCKGLVLLKMVIPSPSFSSSSMTGHSRLPQSPSPPSILREALLSVNSTQFILFDLRSSPFYENTSLLISSSVEVPICVSNLEQL